MVESARGARRPRGPHPKADRGAQTGYRVTARQRLELQVAQAFVGANSLQAVLDTAVSAFVASLRREAKGFSDAVERAEQHQRSRAGVRDISDAETRRR